MRIHNGKLLRRSKNFLSYILVINMVLGLIPQSVYAYTTDIEQNQKTYTSDDCTITYTEGSAWGNNVNVQIVVQNNSDHDKSLWRLTFDYNREIDSIWNADIVSVENGNYVVAAKTYNSTIGAGQSISFGFIAHGTDKKVSAPKAIQFVKESGLEDSSGGNTEDGSSTETGGEFGKEDENVPEQGYVIPEKWKGLEYALFTSGDSDIALYTGQTDITGSVHTNQNFYYQGGSFRVDGTLEAAKGITIKTSDNKDSLNVISKRENAEIIDMPDITKEVSEYAKEHGTIYDSSKEFGTDPIVIENPLYVDGDITFHSTGFSGQGIVYGKDSVTMNVGVAATPDDSRIFIAAQEGNITLNGSNLSLNAILYAPNGCVYINANEFHLNGRIIAKQVVFQGTGFWVKESADDFDMVSFLFPEIVLPVAGLKTDTTYMRDESGYAHISIENLAEIADMTKISEIRYVIYHDADKNGVFSEEEYVNTVGSLEKTVPVTLSQVGNYKVVQQIFMTDGSVITAGDEESAYFEIMNHKPIAGLKIEKDAKVDILMLYNGLDSSQKQNFEMLKSSLEEAGKEQGVSVLVTSKELAVSKGEFNWTIFDHKDYDSRDTHVSRQEDAFSFTSYEKDPLKDFVYTDTGLGKNQVISFTLQQQEKSFDSMEGCGMIFAASVESTENPECYRNHTYKVLDGKMEWDEAQEKCKSLGGYLATVTSEWEKDYIIENVLPESRKFLYWLGGYRDDISVAVWKWVTGEDFYWTNWDIGEPNNRNETVLEMYGKGARCGTWNDTLHPLGGANSTGDSYSTGSIDIICEWDGPHMSGYTLLLTEEGMKLIALNDVDMDSVRNGSYAKLENAGTLLGVFPYDMEVSEHHITIERNNNEITIIDNDAVVVENFALDVNIDGTGVAPIISYKRKSKKQEIKECATISQIKVKELTNTVVQNAIKEHKWESDAARFVIHASEAETEEYLSDVNTANLIKCLLENQIGFIGKGQENVMAFTRLHTAVSGIIAETDGEILEYMNQILKETDKHVNRYITPDDSLICEAQYADIENDPLYRKEWVYDYQKNVLSGEQKDTEQILKEEPITRFENYGTYRLRLRVQDNPVGENEALSEYRLWSEYAEFEFCVHHIPKASIKAEKEMKDNQCYITLLASGSDEDHKEEENNGIIKEYYAYKELDDIEWTEGKIPDNVSCGKYYLIKYEVEDKEHIKSAPAVVCVDTSERKIMDVLKDTEPPKVVLQISSKDVKVKDVIQITSYASDNYGVKNFALYINDEKISEQSGILQYSCYKEGIIKIRAEAEDFNGNKTVESDTVIVGKGGEIAEVETDEECPEIKIENIHFNKDKTLIEIVGTITDNREIESYRISYVNGEDIVIGTGTEQVSESKVIGQLETKSLENGTYNVTILAKDTAGNQTTCCFNLIYNSQMDQVTYEEQDSELHPEEDGHLTEEEIKQLQNAKNSAIEWLKLQADENGSWSKDGLMNTTCNALGVLQFVKEPVDSPAFSSWIEEKGELLNVDERCHALFANPDNAERFKLWEQQNADGGFGLNSHYTSDLYDTLLVIRTEIYMQEMGFDSIQPEKLTNAFSYIITRRNEDGGFGYHNMDDSKVELTAEYVLLLGKLNQDIENYNVMMDFCMEQYNGDFSEESFIKQAMLARVKQQIEKESYTKEVINDLLVVQKDDGSVYGNIEDTMLFVILLDEMMRGE